METTSDLTDSLPLVREQGEDFQEAERAAGEAQNINVVAVCFSLLQGFEERDRLFALLGMEEGGSLKHIHTDARGMLNITEKSLFVTVKLLQQLDP